MTEDPLDGPLGRIHQWEVPDWGGPARAKHTVVRLRHLTGPPNEWRGLSGKFVTVRNASVVYEAGVSEKPTPTIVGDARPDERGDLVFEPGRGGGRIDKVAIAEAGFRARYIQASRFGEVNTYHHVDRIGDYLCELLTEVGAKALPPVVAVVNAHSAAVDLGGLRDGRRCPDGRWVPFQGGHYRLPGRSARIPEHAPLSPDGEIHLGPGQKLTTRGALARLAGGAYRANASHNPSIIYHEYGHHLCRHTADFRANRLRPPDRQSNKKTALDEGTADYFTAVMLGTPHIWFFHHRDDSLEPHRRSLISTRTMETYVPGRAGDPHANGTIWASAIWELRSRIATRTFPPMSGKSVDRLIVQALLLIGEDPPSSATAGERVRSLTAARRSFRRAAETLLRADALLYRGRLRDDIVGALATRGIHPEGSADPVVSTAT